MFKKVLVANRGEIAVRVIRTLRELGIPQTAVYSEADRTALHVSMAGEALCIGSGPAAGSYLDIKSIIAAAKICGADAVHPGYGFLSENAEFSAACAENGIKFIGPSPESINMLGHKAEARKIASRAGVPVTPGTAGCIKGSGRKEAEKTGYPLMIKAAAGGGGRGIRIVRSPGELEHELQLARSEALASFSSGEVYMEKYIENPRHVEVQFARDSSGRAAAFPERDCSIQRRHQKLLEETPSPAVGKKLRSELCSAALKLAHQAGYVGVGTVEFLLDRDGNFYFMEVNTRLQVEHPVTEEITGIDLVREQLLAAAGEKITVSAEVPFSGHSIEHRINAEDFNAGFRPSAGRLEKWQIPGGPGVRVDTHVYQGYNLPVYYDSMLAKLITRAPDRDAAIRRSLRALDEFSAEGICTTIEAHRLILRDENFRRGITDTGFMERLLKAGEKSS